MFTINTVSQFINTYILSHYPSHTHTLTHTDTYILYNLTTLNTLYVLNKLLKVILDVNHS